MKRKLFLFVDGVVLGTMACRPTAPGEPSMPSRAIKCATEAVQREWPHAYPQVQTCLTTITTAPMACLDALPAALQVGIDTVACIVSSVGKEAAAQLGANSKDVVSARKAERASAWLEMRKIRVE
jgi:hypothetical protein